MLWAHLFYIYSSALNLLKLASGERLICGDAEVILERGDEVLKSASRGVKLMPKTAKAEEIGAGRRARSSKMAGGHRAGLLVKLKGVPKWITSSGGSVARRLIPSRGQDSTQRSE